jgi:hypothetical protein
MMSDQYKRELATLVKAAAALRTQIGQQEAAAGKARAEAQRKRTAALRTPSSGTRDMYLRQAEAEEKKVAGAEKKIGELQKKLGENGDRLISKETSLRRALKSEQAASDRAEDARRRKAEAEDEARAKLDAKRRELEKSHAREVARLSRPTVHHVIVREPEPEKLRVLYLTASPTIGGAVPLRVDAEVNNVLKVLRGARYRDLVDLQHRPAATVEDLLDGLNDHRPHVVHFSGHAGGGLLFDNASLIDAGEQLVGYKAVARLLSATDHPPTLVVLNACETLEGAEEILVAAPTVIAMSASVGDASAAVFATQFYGAIAAAQPIGAAVDQARAMIAIALPDEPDLITVCAAIDVDPSKIRLVKPV